MVDINKFTLSIALIKECNYKCSYCYPFGQNKAIGTNMSFDEAKSVVSAAVEFGFRRFRFTGGEPTLFLHFREFIDYVMSLDNEIKVTIVTNGTTLDNNMDLFKNYRDRIVVKVSVDSTNKDHMNFGIYKIVTKKLLDSFNLLAENKITTEINMVVTRINQAEVDEIIKLGQKYGFRVKLLNLFLQTHYIATDGVNGNLGKTSKLTPLEYWQENYIDLDSISKQLKLKTQTHKLDATFMSRGTGIFTEDAHLDKISVRLLESQKGAYYNPDICFGCKFFGNLCEKGVFVPFISSNMTLHLDDCYNTKLRWNLRNTSHEEKITAFGEIMSLFEKLEFINRDYHF